MSYLKLRTYKKTELEESMQDVEGEKVVQKKYARILPR